jgi:methyl-accepting chemotaxis protein
MSMNLSIGSKIRLSLCILVLGYFVTMAVGFMLGKKTESRLTGASDTLFPASTYSKSASTVFKEQIKLYSDAVIMGDEEKITTADGKGREVIAALESITALDGLNTEKKRQVEETIAQLKKFLASAGVVYKQMSNSQSSGSASNDAVALARQTEEIQKNLSSFGQGFTDDLKAELNSISQSTKYQRFANLYVFFGVVIFAFALISLIINRSITKPIRDTVLMIKDIAEGEGDLTRRLDIKSNDEIRELANWFNLFLDKLQKIIKQIAENSNIMDSSSSELLSIAGKMSSSSEKTHNLANTVAMSTEDMSSNLNEVVSAMDQSSTAANMMAAASEEMMATITEIAQNCEKTRDVSDRAVIQARNTGEKMSELGKAAKDIGKITETITEISEQTNLLSLNATIEAARAGEAGKGFVVVANEIKELARQTALSTKDIKNKIDGIQKVTGLTATEIDKIIEVINNVNEFVAGISTAIEEQSITTRDIAEKISQTSQGIQQVNRSANNISQASAQIAGDISRVKTSTNEISDNSGHVNTRAGNLKEIAEQLNRIVHSFRV